MLRLTHKLDDDCGRAPTATLTLPFFERRRSRFRARLDDGAEVGVVLPRGTVLRDGDLLGDEGEHAVVQVRAGRESLSTVRSQDPTLLARACYHLGNRHVSLQIEAGRAQYLHDHVLDDMVRGLGLEVTVETSPFEPEAGAYAAGHHGHEHGHEHEHAHEPEPDAS